MKLFQQFIAWLKLNRKAVQFYAIILIILFALSAYIARQIAVKQELNNAVELQRLQSERNALKSKNIILDARINSSEAVVTRLKKEKQQITMQRDAYARELEITRRERDEAIAKLDPMTDDELFQRFLVLFPQSGEKEFIVNENQVRQVVTVSVLYEYAVNENELLKDDIQQCNNLVIKGDSINQRQRSIIDTLHEKDSTNNEIILNLSDQNDLKDKQIKKTERSKKFAWGVATVTSIIAFVMTLFAA